MVLDIMPPIQMSLKTFTHITPKMIKHIPIPEIMLLPILVLIVHLCANDVANVKLDL